MKYKSTRGKVTGLSFEDVLFAGYAPDGGLYVPTTIPKLDSGKLTSWMETKPSYPTIVTEIARLFIAEAEIPTNALRQCVAKAYTEKFSNPDIVGISKPLKTETGKSFKVAELFHGPTQSFKDYALSLVGQFMRYFLSQRKDHVTILVGTSGDTGSAAIKAVEGLEGMDIIVLYPKENISPVQELQMNSSVHQNVHVFAVEGTSDDLDVPIKQCFPDSRLCSINSINWARIMIQVAHFVYLYIHEGKALDIFVPTGAAGNGSSAILASLMGLPVKLFVATNENDNVEAFFNKGFLRFGGVVKITPANAMDIGYAYNLERILYFISNSTDITRQLMDACTATPSSVAKVPQDILTKVREIVVRCKKVPTDQIYSTIKSCWDKNHYVVCPHTATAVALCAETPPTSSNSLSIVISTASPHKFPEVITHTGIIPSDWNGNSLLHRLQTGPQVPPNKSMTISTNWLEIVQCKIASIQAIHASKISSNHN